MSDPSPRPMLPSVASSHSSGFGTRALAPPRITTSSSATPDNRSPQQVEAGLPPSRFSTRSPLSHTGGSPTATTGIGMRHRHLSTSSQKSKEMKYRWLSTSVAGGTGDEPGVDVRSRRDEESYGHLKGKTEIKVVDYSSNPEDTLTNLTSEFPGERLGEWLASDHGKRQLGEDGKPLGVRWIHVDGVNWEVVKTLVLHYGLHPLSVEDALEASESPRSKLDFYKNHLYLQLLIHHTEPSDEAELSLVADELSEASHTGFMESSEGGDREKGYGGGKKKPGLLSSLTGGKESKLARLPEGVQGVFEPSMISTRRGAGSHRASAKQAHKLTVDELSAEYMVPIRRGILSVFMLRDGTLISMDAKPTREVLGPIYTRLQDEQSLLRRTGDVSMLAEAILDTVVDLAVEITQTFESEILNLEASVLVDPQMETVRHLHVLSSQLIRLRRSLTPLLHVCYIVRDQDLQRSAAATAVASNSPRERGSSVLTQHQSPLGQHSGENGQGQAQQPQQQQSPHPTFSINPPSVSRVPSGTFTPHRAASGDHPDNASVLSLMGLNGTQATGAGVAGAAGVGFFSPLTKVYIGDVIDHLEIVVGSIEQFVSTCDHLTDYVFNVLSFQTNASMERLSIVTVVFLPLTFIASYFGMNFTGFAQLEGPVSYFWKVAIPCTAAFFVIFSFSYLKAFLVTTGRRLGRWKRAREVGAGTAGGGKARAARAARAKRAESEKGE
ncbi:hypothetical protein IAT38_004916 [Cryptococcus sp. DSM 104549]